MIIRIGLVTIFSLLWLTPLLAQAPDSQPYIELKRVKQEIKLDGVLDEPDWFAGQPAKNFWQNFPSDSIQSPVQTEIYMAYDDNFLYIGAKCHSVGEDYVVPTLRRDYRASGADNLTFLINPFNDGTNAFVFGINPLGATREALISNGGRGIQDWNGSWDNKWNSISKIHKGYWVCEVAIPFSTLRFREGSQEWSFNSYRFDTQSGTRSTWMRIPRNQIIMNLAYSGKMYWEEPLKKPGANISLIPYATAGMTQIYAPKEDQGKSDNFGIGGDAKIGITPGLNLDLTINPDFSQVEVDQQVTNLDRFEIRFPERRQFFLENADLFATFGDERANPFFSRRIGIATDTSSGNNIQNPILFGARLSGKINDNWRVGFLSMQTAKDVKNALPSFNYTVAALQRKIASRSNLGLIFVNKQHFTQQDSSDLYDSYNRVAGIDYNVASSDNSWVGKFFLHHSMGPTSNKAPFSHGARLAHIKRRYMLQWNHQWVGEEYDAQVGFVPRKNFFNISPEAALFYYPKKGAIVQHGPALETSLLWTPGLGRTDHSFELSWEFDFRSTSRLSLELTNEYTYLGEDQGFDPTRKNDVNLDTLRGYNYTSFGISYNSDGRKFLSLRLNPTIGQFYSGFRTGLGGSLNLRFQPLGTIALSFNYNYIDLGSPFKATSLFLIGPRIDLTFSKTLFLTTFIQYNNQVDNININARFQWRFAPVSDFFLVYTDNYYANNIQVKSRAIVAKVTYWLNL